MLFKNNMNFKFDLPNNKKLTFITVVFSFNLIGKYEVNKLK